VHKNVQLLQIEDSRELSKAAFFLWQFQIPWPAKIQVLIRTRVVWVLLCLLRSHTALHLLHQPLTLTCGGVEVKVLTTSSWNNKRYGQHATGTQHGC
jgi:hypothetical protein